MLHEEVTINWNEIANVVQDFHFMDSVRNYLIVGVNTLNYKKIKILIVVFPGLRDFYR